MARTRRYPERVCARVSPAQRKAAVDFATLTGQSYAAGVRAGLEVIAGRRGARELAPAMVEAAPELGPTDKVRAGYLAVTGGRFDVRVRLADLRPAVDLPRKALDAALMQLLRERAAHLLPLDDPEERRPADRAAALRIAGEPRHLVYLER